MEELLQKVFETVLDISSHDLLFFARLNYVNKSLRLLDLNAHRVEDACVDQREQERRQRPRYDQNEVRIRALHRHGPVGRRLAVSGPQA